MNTMNEDVLKALKQHLPGAMGDLLKERLAEADRLEAAIKVANSNVKNYSKSLDEARARIEELEAQQQKVEDLALKCEKTDEALKAREEAITKRENTQELILLRTQLEMTTEANTKVENLVQAVFRNNTVRKTVTESISDPGTPYSRYGNDGYSDCGTHGAKSTTICTNTKEEEGPVD